MADDDSGPVAQGREFTWTNQDFTRIKALIHVDDAIKHESIERARARVLDDKGDGDA